METETKQINKKTLKGIVVSDKMDKTVVVSVKDFKKHAKYGKYYRTDKKYKAHDEDNTLKIGDEVLIQETKPMSKDKSFVVLEK